MSCMGLSKTMHQELNADFSASTVSFFNRKFSFQFNLTWKSTAATLRKAQILNQL